jgi:hypothetical protein
VTVATCSPRSPARAAVTGHWRCARGVRPVSGAIGARRTPASPATDVDLGLKLRQLRVCFGYESGGWGGVSASTRVELREAL